MTHHLADRTGDAGFLRESKTRIRRRDPEDDTLFLSGAVTGQREDGGRGLVEIRRRAASRGGELSIPGTGVVALPRRG